MTWEDQAQALRRFGSALVRDDHHVRDEREVDALVEVLTRRAIMLSQATSVRDAWARRQALFAAFIRFHRRHARLIAIENEGIEPAPRPREAEFERGPSRIAVERAVRGLPLEQREVLLLVVLEGYSHLDAASVLEIPLSALVTRLGQARANLDRALNEHRSSWRAIQPPAHLRLVK